MELYSAVHNWRKLRGSCQHILHRHSCTLSAALLLACLRSLVGEELEHKPASRLLVDVNVEKDPWSISGSHVEQTLLFDGWMSARG